MMYFFCSCTLIYRRVQNVGLVHTSFITRNIFLSLWNLRDRRGINPLNSISILAWEQFRSGERLLEFTIMYNCVHVILWTLNNEIYCSAFFLDLVRYLWLEIVAVLFDRQSGLCSELYHYDGKQGAYILSLNSHCI